jgi:hypothetical protein
MKIDVNETGYEGVKLIYRAQTRSRTMAIVKAVVIKHSFRLEHEAT